MSAAESPDHCQAGTDQHYGTVSITVVTCATVFHNIYLFQNIWVTGSG